ncbi:hypothetical protein M8542_36055 [Amycolatopsis sp. OK19-0408]|uniref:Uncharacterized protein n=1 Tax=Amycolatopsis iheyensis TaxID=2945988 RepID=A0A9X2SNR0_9PSEU|nr:hypothetical protein [Amycolatopsis iheyensis]MCR6488258.1 hypothetical protein [Amycolatopsis iheyensis]
MKARTVWAALLAGEPGVIFGVSVLVFVVVVAVVLVFCDVAPRRVEVPEGDRPTVWQLQRQSPRNREEWLRRRIEAYRGAIRARAAEVAQESAAMADREAKLVALVTDDDWPTLEDLHEAEDASVDVRAASGLPGAAAQACKPLPIAPDGSCCGQLRLVVSHEPRPLAFGPREIAA